MKTTLLNSLAWTAAALGCLAMVFGAQADEHLRQLALAPGQQKPLDDDWAGERAATPTWSGPAPSADFAALPTVPGRDTHWASGWEPLVTSAENAYGLAVYWHCAGPIPMPAYDESVDVYRLAAPADEENLVAALATPLGLGAPERVAVCETLPGATGPEARTWTLRLRAAGQTRVSYLKGRGLMQIRNPSAAERGGSIRFDPELAPAIVAAYLDCIGQPLSAREPVPCQVEPHPITRLAADGTEVVTQIDAVRVVAEQRVGGARIVRGGGRLSATLVGRGEVALLTRDWLVLEYWLTVTGQQGYRGRAGALYAFLGGEVRSEDEARMTYLARYGAVTIQSVETTDDGHWWKATYEG